MQKDGERERKLSIFLFRPSPFLCFSHALCLSLSLSLSHTLFEKLLSVNEQFEESILRRILERVRDKESGGGSNDGERGAAAAGGPPSAPAAEGGEPPRRETEGQLTDD